MKHPLLMIEDNEQNLHLEKPINPETFAGEIEQHLKARPPGGGVQS